MANDDFNENFTGLRHNAGSQKKEIKTSTSTMNEKNVNWPGLPGKTQGKNRSGGTPKAKIYPVSEGL